MLDAHGDGAQGHRHQKEVEIAPQTRLRWLPSMGGYLPDLPGRDAIIRCQHFPFDHIEWRYLLHHSIKQYLPQHIQNSNLRPHWLLRGIINTYRSVPSTCKTYRQPYSRLIV